MEKRIAKVSFVVLSSTLLCALFALGFVRFAEIASDVWGVISARFLASYAVLLEGAKEQVVEIDPNSKPIQIMIDDASENFGVPKEIIEAIIHVESGKTINPHRVRFESKIFAGLKAIKGESDIERRMRASSHGLMQVMGFNAARCGIDWPELYQPKKNLTCGLKILKDCLDRHRAKPPTEQFVGALGCYNGDPINYPTKVRLALADLVVSKLALQTVTAKLLATPTHSNVERIF